MKAYKYTSILIFAVFSITFTACENEPIDSGFFSEDGALIIDAGGDNGTGTSGGNSTGDYWPLAVNNAWSYNHYIDGVAQENYTMDIISNEIYQGESSYKFGQYLPSVTGSDGTELGDFQIDNYVRKNGGDYIVTVADLNASYLDGLFNLTQTGYSLLILKDYVAVGTTWTQNAQTVTTFVSNDPLFPDLPSITNNISNSLEIVEKGISVSVNGTTYSDVIKVKLLQETVAPAAPDQTTSSLLYYYFAKDVGLVKTEGSSSDNADNVTLTTLQELYSYTLN